MSLTEKYKTLVTAVVATAMSLPYSADCQTIATPSLNFNDSAVSRTHVQPFAVDSALVRSDASLHSFAALVDSVNSMGAVSRIDIEGAASPDGPLSYNRRLARRRAEALKGYFTSHTSVPDSLFEITSIAEDWDLFRTMLPQSLTDADIAAVDSIIASTESLDRRERMLRRYDNGRVWRILVADILPALRRASMTVALNSGEQMLFSTTSSRRAQLEKVAARPVRPEATSVITPRAVIPLSPTYTPAQPALHWYLKTNLPAWGMLLANIAVEFDCAPHWSVQLPIYYSGFNYFTSRRKFRTFAIIPEARYWFRSDNQGWFAGAHLGMAYYNIALGGTTRYQDHDGNSPALGGGLDFGYRLRLGATRRWRLEFSLGAGVYHLDYDEFRNCHNGLLTGRTRRTFVGIDNAAVSLCYTFDLKKGGRR